MDNSFDKDGQILHLAFKDCNQKQYLTEAITLMYMVEVESLMLTAMSHFIRSHGLDDMLLENETKFWLDYEINKEMSLKQFLGPGHFKKLILRSVENIGD